jgi:hypothetical protein
VGAAGQEDVPGQTRRTVRTRAEIRTIGSVLVADIVLVGTILFTVTALAMSGLDSFERLPLAPRAQLVVRSQRGQTRAMTDQGGDPACWADRVCPECGQFIEDERHACVQLARDDSEERHDR